jgi:hypothetical protein
MQRDRVWPLLLFVQMTGAMVSRLAQSGIRSPSFQVGVVVFTALIETSLRLTVLERDELMRNLFWRLRGRRRKAIRRVHSAIIDVRQVKVLSSHLIAASQIDAEASDVQEPTAGQYVEARRAYFSDLVCVEMVGEYVGIFVSPILIVVWRSRPLLGVFSYYSNSRTRSSMGRSRSGR